MASSNLICDTESWKELRVSNFKISPYELLSNFTISPYELLLCNQWEIFVLSQAHVDDINNTHLRDLMNDTNRCQSMMAYDT